MAQDTTNKAKRNDKLLENINMTNGLTALICNQLLQIIKKKMEDKDDDLYFRSSILEVVCFIISFPPPFMLFRCEGSLALHYLPWAVYTVFLLRNEMCLNATELRQAWSFSNLTADMGCAPLIAGLAPGSSHNPSCPISSSL